MVAFLFHLLFPFFSRAPLGLYLFSRRVVREMLEKEEHFLDDIKCLIEVFRDPLIRSKITSPKVGLCPHSPSLFILYIFSHRPPSSPTLSVFLSFSFSFLVVQVIDIVFANVDKLRVFSERMVDAIATLLDNWDDQTTCMDQVFTQDTLTECMGLFRTFITGHETAKSTLVRKPSKLNHAERKYDKATTLSKQARAKIQSVFIHHDFLLDFRLTRSNK